MSPRSLALVCAAAAVAAGCGESRAERAFDRQREACLGFPAAGATLRDVEAALGSTPVQGILRCLGGEESGLPGELVRRLDNDVCDHTGMLCDYGFCYYPSDPALCGPNGCWYGCGVRVEQPAEGPGAITGDTPICGSRFASEQPLPPVCPF